MPGPIEPKSKFLLSNGFHMTKPPQMKQWLVIIVVMSALVIGYRWLATHDAIPVTAAPVNKALLPHVVRGRGQLQAIDVVDVVSPLPGQLSKVQLKVGDRVAQGQILA